jgi:Na+/phosphate symporter
MGMKEQVFELHELISEMVDGIDTMYTAFIYNNAALVERLEDGLGRASERAAALTEGLVEEKKNEPRAGLYVSVPSHVGRMSDGLASIASALKTKIRDDVLFSDRAMSEVDFMFGRIRDILVNARDMVLAPNVLVGRHMVESEAIFEKIADEYATRHEERLIEGLCAPKASQLYIQMIDAFKSIAWHAKELAKDLGK